MSSGGREVSWVRGRRGERERLSLLDVSLLDSLRLRLCSSVLRTTLSRNRVFGLAALARSRCAEGPSSRYRASSSEERARRAAATSASLSGSGAPVIADRTCWDAIWESDARPLARMRRASSIEQTAWGVDDGRVSTFSVTEPAWKISLEIFAQHRLLFITRRSLLKLGSWSITERGADDA